MRYIITWCCFLICVVVVAQDKKEKQKETLEANKLVYKGNNLFQENNFVDAEMAYRKAISKAPSQAEGAYNLATAYYKEGNYNEALLRVEEAAKNATTKAEKHRAYHNLGNVLMQKELCKEAVEAFKNALRNNPNDDETRYNFALAKECAEDQKNDGGGEDDKEDPNKDNEQDKKDQDKKNQDNKDNDKNEDDKKKDGEEEEDDKGKPKDDKKDNNKEGDNKNKKKPKPGQMSPQQIKNLLEAMQNQEQKVQEKVNAQKQKGARVKTEKDW